MPDAKETQKRKAAEAAARYVRHGQIVGLGTGSTARYLVLALGSRVRDEGLEIRGVATSTETAELARQQGIPLLDPDDDWMLDVALDGADQVDPQLNLIKGGGGALLKEKIVAAAARRLVIMVDAGKRVPMLGGWMPLPIEVVPFGWRSTARLIERLGGKVKRRERDGRVFRTEAGHYILDLHLEQIPDPAGLERVLTLIPGVVETGLFVDRTDVLLVGTDHEVEVHEAPKARR